MGIKDREWWPAPLQDQRTPLPFVTGVVVVIAVAVVLALAFRYVVRHLV